MPSPLGHALGGLIVAVATAPKHDGPDGPHRVLGVPRVHLGVCVFAACLPDIDFAWGRHNMETHSIAFALLVALLVLMWRRSPGLAAASGLAVITHIAFDWLGSDDSPPLGVMALWPFSHEFYFADAYVFATISRRYWLPGFVQHNVLAVLREVVILLPMTAFAYWYRERAGWLRSRSRPPAA